VLRGGENNKRRLDGNDHGLLPGSHCQDQALAVLCVPYSLDSGLAATETSRSLNLVRGRVLGGGENDEHRLDGNGDALRGALRLGNEFYYTE